MIPYKFYLILPSRGPQLIWESNATWDANTATLRVNGSSSVLDYFGHSGPSGVRLWFTDDVGVHFTASRGVNNLYIAPPKDGRYRLRVGAERVLIKVGPNAWSLTSQKDYNTLSAIYRNLSGPELVHPTDPMKRVRLPPGKLTWSGDEFYLRTPEMKNMEFAEAYGGGTTTVGPATANLAPNTNFVAQAEMAEKMRAAWPQFHQFWKKREFTVDESKTVKGKFYDGSLGAPYEFPTSKSFHLGETW